MHDNPKATRAERLELARAELVRQKAEKRAQRDVEAVRAYAEQVAALAPDLTQEQIQKLSVLFAGAGGSAEAIKRSAECYRREQESA